MTTDLTLPEQQQLRFLIRETLELNAAENLEKIEDTTVVMELPGVDSMKLLHLLGAVEIGFQVNLGFEAIPQVRTVHDIQRLICESREQLTSRIPNNGGRA